MNHSPTPLPEVNPLELAVLRLLHTNTQPRFVDPGMGPRIVFELVKKGCLASTGSGNDMLLTRTGLAVLAARPQKKMTERQLAARREKAEREQAERNGGKSPAYVKLASCIR